jgi:predicted GH43/DUF377 family glycosyl hydrolase
MAPSNQPRVTRYPENPLITPSDVQPSIDGWEVLCAFNAGAIEFSGEVMLLMRVAERPVVDDASRVIVPTVNCAGSKPTIEILEFTADTPGIDLRDPRVITLNGKLMLTSLSHLRLARSKDGRHFTVDPKPALFPDRCYESYGLEDPRITKIGDTYYVTYKGVSGNAILQCLASTKDFVTWEKHGIILPPENMDGMLFPEKIRGKYALLHRPMPRYMGAPNMWVAYSDDLIHWGEHALMLACAEDTWEGGRLGGGAVPFLTDKGWLEIYHAATPGERYCLGAALLDRDYPERVIAKSPSPILEPEAPYEVHGFKDDVVFTCGAIVRGDTVTIYYGGADLVMAAADMSVSEIIASLE